LQTYFTRARASNHASVIYIFKTNQLDPRSQGVVQLIRALVPTCDQGSSLAKRS